MKLKKINQLKDNNDIIILLAKDARPDIVGLPDIAINYMHRILKASSSCYLWGSKQNILAVRPDEKKKNHEIKEAARQAGHNAFKQSVTHRLESPVLVNCGYDEETILKFAEGFYLSAYNFDKYKTEKDKSHKIESLGIYDDGIKADDLTQLSLLLDSVYWARDLVNEPLSWLDAQRFANESSRLKRIENVSVKVLEHSDIKELGMGGLLAVNKGSQAPPLFMILKYESPKPVQENPVVLVGKGIVYDSGGMSLKPTKGSMDTMKCDMAGAAGVVASFRAVAERKLPINLIALVPLTDNMPGPNAYVPGDVIKMHSGLTVEVLNTDAEGRLILADALSFAKTYKPALVVDMATLTGAAAVAVGIHAAVIMGNIRGKLMNALKKAGNATYERVVEFPLWEEYGEMIKSDIADIKNLGGRDAGAITAGKFLEKFTDYKWCHIDMAGPAFTETQHSYNGKGGTGYGVRLIVEFIQRYIRLTEESNEKV